MAGDKGKDIAQSPEFTRVQDASLSPAAHHDVRKEVECALPRSLIGRILVLA
jgi:hypothetical protein